MSLKENQYFCSIWWCSWARLIQQGRWLGDNA